MAAVTDKLFIDANVLLELLQERKYLAEVKQALEDHREYLMVTSILCVDLVLYFVERDKANKQAAFQFLAGYEILGMNSTDYAWAKDNDQGDFEDALQVACALRHGCRRLLTLDKTLAQNHQKHIAVALLS